MASTTILRRALVLLALILTPASTTPTPLTQRADPIPTQIPLAPGPPSDNVVIGVTIFGIVCFFGILIGIYYWVAACNKAEAKSLRGLRSGSSTTSSASIYAIRVQEPPGLVAGMKLDMRRKMTMQMRDNPDGTISMVRPKRVKISVARVSTDSSSSA